MDNQAQFFAAEIAKIQEKTNTTQTLVKAQQLQLNNSNNDIAKLDVSTENAIKQLAEAKTNLWRLQTNKMNVLKQDKEIRTMCYQRRQDIDEISSNLKDLNAISTNINELLHSNVSMGEPKKEFKKLQLRCKQKYEREILKLKEKRAALKREISEKEKRVQKTYDDIKSAGDEEAELMSLNKQREAKEADLIADRDRNRKLSNEISQKQSVVQREVTALAAQKETTLTKLKEEICDREIKTKLREQEYESLQKKDAKLTVDQKAKEEEYVKLKESVEKLQCESDTLERTNKHKKLYSKQLVEMFLLCIKKSENITADNVDLEKCGELLGKELEDLNKENAEYENCNGQSGIIEQSEKEYTEKIEKTGGEFEKLRADHQAAELEWNELSIECKHEPEKHAILLTELKIEKDKQLSLFRALSEEIRELENDTTKRKEDYMKKKQEQEKIHYQLIEVEKLQIKQLAACTEELKKFERKCDDLFYDLIKLENKKLTTYGYDNMAQVNKSTRIKALCMKQTDKNVTENKSRKKVSNKRIKLEELWK